MITIQGKYGAADVYVSGVDALDANSHQQILQLLDVPCMKGQKIAIMPDVHAGKGCVIGYTQTVTDSIVPNLVGVDVSCGMHVVQVSPKYNFDFKRLDKLIRKEIPFGTAHRTKLHPFAENVDFANLVANVNAEKLKYSVGSLGGGNHFIEVDVDDEGNRYIVIHSGSRFLGVEVCGFHQRRAMEQRTSEGSDAELPNPHLAWLEGDYLADYLNDMRICTQFADMNRKAMMDIILDGMEIKRRYIMDSFTTVHNYVDVDHMVIRKGAISLQKDEVAIIPMNMRDGSLIVKGKGNEVCNCSGPHGAGRVLSRSAAKEALSMEEFKKSMAGIFTTSVSTETLDESPMAYKSMQSILDNIGDMCDVVKTIRPLYNFKAS